MRSVHQRASLLIVFSSAIAFAAPPKRSAEKPLPAATNPPRIALTLAAPSVNAWRLRVENVGEVPLRLVADARLLSLEITPPTGKPVHCALPSDARPVSDAAGGVVLMPKTAFDSFD